MPDSLEAAITFALVVAPGYLDGDQIVALKFDEIG
jgi:hypothetical protein